MTNHVKMNIEPPLLGDGRTFKIGAHNGVRTVPLTGAGYSLTQATGMRDGTRAFRDDHAPEYPGH